MTDNIRVISVVGRYLEHSRIYRFGVGEDEKIYIASADFMTRNTVRRVEVAAPVHDEHARKKICHIFDTIMLDDEKGFLDIDIVFYFAFVFIHFRICFTYSIVN